MRKKKKEALLEHTMLTVYWTTFKKGIDSLDYKA